MISTVGCVTRYAPTPHQPTVGCVTRYAPTPHQPTVGCVTRYAPPPSSITRKKMVRNELRTLRSFN